MLMMVGRENSNRIVGLDNRSIHVEEVEFYWCMYGVVQPEMGPDIFI